MRDIYGKGSILLVRRQKLAIEKLGKKTSKSYNIKALWKCNRNLDLNSKANASVSKLAESSKLISDKERNSVYFFSNITQKEIETPILSEPKLWQT